MSNQFNTGILRLKDFISKNKKPIIVLTLVLIIIILFLFGTKIYLFLHLLIGNDIVISLDQSTTDLKLVKGQSQEVSFKASVRTNPFCSAYCSYYFEDLSSGTVLDNNSFTLKSLMPFEKKYPVQISDLGTGQKLLRFNMECKSKSTSFCKTNEKPTSRNAVLSVEYSLNEEESAMKESLKPRFAEFTNKLSLLNYSLSLAGYIFDELEAKANSSTFSYNSTSQLNALKLSLSEYLNELSYFNNSWAIGDYSSVNSVLASLEPEISEKLSVAANLSNALNLTVVSYNAMADQFQQIGDMLTYLGRIPLPDAQAHEELEGFYEEFNQTAKLLFGNNAFEVKKATVSSLAKEIAPFYSDATNFLIKNTLGNLIHADIAYNLICLLNFTCVSRSSISERASINVSFDDHSLNNLSLNNLSLNNLSFDNLSFNNFSQNQNLKSSCKDLEDLRLLLDNMNTTLSNISSEYILLRNNITQQMLLDLPENKTNSNIIKEILSAELSFNGEDFSQQACAFNESLNVTLPAYSLAKINLALNLTLNLTSETKAINFTMQEAPRCCVLGNCTSCCVGNECYYNKSLYPIILLHGHSFNEGVEAEYSLDAFRQIQDQLEKDNYIDAGSFTLYTPVVDGTLGMIKMPVSLRVSYYVDVLEHPENNILIQSKSENIDTYAIRLNDLIKSVKYATNKEKVIIIAHSMGGLVTRRYLQIFGEQDVSKLILIATPNEGITEEITGKCSILGSSQECNDMDSQSLFINKVSKYSPKSLDAYNIIGIGCTMKYGDGDGIVLNENAVLDSAYNYFVNGTCSGISLLHTQLLDISKYPRVYEIIINALSS